MNKSFLNNSNKDKGESWLNVSDMMAGLMMVFLLKKIAMILEIVNLLNFVNFSLVQTTTFLLMILRIIILF